MAMQVLLFVICISFVSSTLVHPYEETEQCRQHLDLYKLALTERQDWALRMYDSSVKLPEGILEGIWVYLGNFDECLAVDAPTLEGETSPQFMGKYCRVYLTNITDPVPQENDYLEDEDLQDDDLEVNYSHLMGLPLRHAILNTMHENHDSKITPGDLMSMMRKVQISVCAPSSCGPEGVAELTSHNLGLVLGGATVTAVTVPDSCVYREDPARELDSADWGFISLLIILAVVILVSTAYDFYITEKEMTAKHEALLAFSLRSNFYNLFTTHSEPNNTDNAIPCLHGMRVFALFLVGLHYRYRSYTRSYLPIINQNFAEQKFVTKWYNYNMLGNFIDIDTFFLLSGVLISYKICSNTLNGNKFGLSHLPRYYIYRFIRLTATLALFVFFMATVADFVGNGPLWSAMVTPNVKNCQSNWWSTLLYINNYVNNDNVCLTHSWYLSVDMQMFWLAPLVLIPLVRWPKITLICIDVLILGSFGAIFGVTYVNELPWSIPLNSATDPIKMNQYWDWIYVNTPMRAQSYLCGLSLGYFLSRTDLLQSLRIPKWGVIIGWILSIAIGFAVPYTLVISYQESYEYNVLDAAFYSSLHRLGWALAMSWIIFACFTKRGGIVNSVLSWRLLQPFSRLSYSIYLVHAVFFAMQGATWRNHGYFSHFTAIHTYLGDIFYIVPTAALLYFVIEAPSLVLIRSFNNDKKSSSISEENLVEETDKKIED